MCTGVWEIPGAVLAGVADPQVAQIHFNLVLNESRILLTTNSASPRTFEPAIRGGVAPCRTATQDGARGVRLLSLDSGSTLPFSADFNKLPSFNSFQARHLMRDGVMSAPSSYHSQLYWTRQWISSEAVHDRKVLPLATPSPTWRRLGLIVDHPYKGGGWFLLGIFSPSEQDTTCRPTLFTQWLDTDGFIQNSMGRILSACRLQ